MSPASGPEVTNDVMDVRWSGLGLEGPFVRITFLHSNRNAFLTVGLEWGPNEGKIGGDWRGDGRQLRNGLMAL